MKKIFFIIIIFAVILIIIIGFQILNRPNENQSPQILPPSESVTKISDLETQTNNEGSVSITVTPKLSDKEWAFEIALNTHAVDISEDLTNVSNLADENGNEYKPVEWQGDPPGGHHRKGTLRFAPISAEQKSITLKIRNIGGVEERNFIWQLK